MLAAGLVGCDGAAGGGDGGGPSPTPPSTGSGGTDRGVLATVHWTGHPSVRTDLMGLNRLGDEHVVAQVRLTQTDRRATGGRRLYIGAGPLWDYVGEYTDQRDGWFSGIGLVDAAARQLLMPYHTDDGGCLCSRAKSEDGPHDLGVHNLEYGTPLDLFAVLPAPSGGATVTTVWTVMAPPMVNVPISDEPAVLPDGAPLPDPAAPGTTRISYRIETPSEALDGSRESVDDGQRVEVHVSSDVLFEIDKADLSPKARDVLRDVAAQIDASTGTVVTIEGHADSTGTDAINDPLSLARAEAVHDELRSLVTRTGITYEVEGYGSHRPRYPNNTEERRRRNRRVTIIFTSPEASAPVRPPTVPPDEPAPDEAVLTTERTVEGQRLTLELIGLDAIGGGLGALRFRITNHGAQQVYDQELGLLAHLQPFNRWATDNVAVVDVARQVAYGPGHLIDEGTSVSCACSLGAGGWHSFEAGQARDFHVIVQLPEHTDSFTVQISEFPDLTAVPVSR
jgi:outer membrane protein OmpA-like peptidoglycan-associated protein